MDKMELQDVKVQKERKDVKGSRGLQEIPTLSPSKETKGNKDPQASTAFLDHEELKVYEELLVSQGIQASMEPLAS